MRLILVVCILAISLSGCGKSGDSGIPTASNTPKTKGVIGLSVLSTTNPFFNVIAESMTEEAAKNGYRVQVVSGDFDVAKQQNQVKDFIVQKVSAIVLTPCDSKSIGPALKEANEPR